MTVLIPTKKIPQLTAYGLPLAGTEMLEIDVTSTSRRITTRDFVLPIDSILTVTPFAVPGSNARQLVSSPTVQVTDGGPGGTVQLDALFTGALPGNPTSLVGLAAVNGAAVTWMRSDAAPALDQAIAPNWTSQHIFQRVSTGLFYPLRANSAAPGIGLQETDAAADNQLWDFIVSGEQLSGRVRSDDGLTNASWVDVNRTGPVVDSVNLLGTAVQANGSAILTAATAFANPTASVGLAAVNGVATTAMRSDGAPALSQAIAPTWTAQHIFSLSGAANAAILVSSVQPQTDYNETDAAANNRRWRWEAQGEQFLGRTVDDVNSAAVTWIAVDRTLNVVDAIALTSTALTWNGNALLSTATAFANPTGTVGLATVNGVATTAMRSDAAPPLSQSIAPTWTAQHTFSQSGLSTPAITLASAIPTQLWNETDAAADNRRWYIQANGEILQFGVVNDAFSVSANFMTVDRTGAVVDSVTFPSLMLLTLPGNGQATTPLDIASTLPQLNFRETDAAADNRIWSFSVASEAFRARLVNDAGSSSTDWLQVDRTGLTVDSLLFPNGAAIFRGGITGATTTQAQIGTRSSTPTIILTNATPAADNRNWETFVNTSGTFAIRTLNDAASSSADAIVITRSGTTVTAISMPTATAASLVIGPGAPSLTNRMTTITGATTGVLGVTQTAGSAFDCIGVHNTGTTGDNLFMQFGTEASISVRGSIDYNRAGGLVRYNTTSDERRKKNIVDSPDSAALIDAIRVRSFDWIDSESHVDFWFVAQELHRLVPMAVSVGSDDRDWGVDPSKLVPLLVKEIQSIRKRLQLAGI